MAKGKAGKQARKEAQNSEGPWISMKTALIVIGITSIFMFVLTAMQAVPARGWGEGLLVSLLFGAMIWAIFFLLIIVNRFLRR